MVGASVIAVTPVTAPPPAMQSHAIQLSAAIDNPIDVFTPVFNQAGTVIQNAIQAEIDDPFPIVNGLIGKLAADGKTLGDMANTLGQSYAGLVAGLPGALTTYAQKLAAGDFSGAVAAFMPIAFGPFLTTFFQLMNFQNFVKAQFDVAAKLTNAAMMTAWSLGPGQLLSVYGVISAVTGTLDELVKAVPKGDPGQIVNVIQHGLANTAIKTLGAIDMWRWSFDSARQGFRDILNPPPPDPGEFTAAVTRKLTTLSLPAAVTPAVEAPSTQVTQATQTAAATTTETPSETASATTKTPESSATEAEAAKPVVRDSLVAAPGKTGAPTTTNKPAAKLVSDVGERVSATVNKIGEGLKKAFTKPAKADTAKSDAGGSGSAKHSAGAGNSGDAK
ncbi:MULTISPECIES: hypothetical protein [unclassified Mycolicibacterium]|uniref:hypothetical protein n=1 Tax=unclassified Mycolicibacterium TaxID=2636767 RepID=UPI0012DC3A27|nr:MULTISPECIES: hypothetical protein [unclassified Mycolicibacterium]MUM01666.1 hypothetical protein [Mycolicibacterium sp. CBMA 334]MUM43908.1 hypothetical protein [Mycolicibacterium sp. CBMA 294]